ncbi:MAG: butyrate kinase [Acholeplasma sp.]|nr:butyrate kinase [Acholeplasma sp.]
MDKNYILVINPGSTSTKIALFKNDILIKTTSIRHDAKELLGFNQVIDQLPYRMKALNQAILDYQLDLNTLRAVVGRGGLLKPIESGTYLVNDSIIKDLKNAIRGEHASNLGAIMAYEIAKPLGIDAFIVDPVVVDEMSEIARVSGMKDIERISTFHALNHKAVARKVAKLLNKSYESLNLIIAHLGGGISVAAHQNGRVIDVNNALDGDGPMSPERSGTVPLGPLYHMCFSSNYTLKDIKQKNYGAGGLVAYLGTSDAKEVLEMINNGNQHAKLILDAMCYQISKEIGAISTVFKGQVDAIVLTGGLAHNAYITDLVKNSVSFISEVIIYPGEDEMSALNEGALRVLNHEEKAKVYR